MGHPDQTGKCLKGSKMKNFYIFNTGCIRRALDSTRIYDYLVKNDWRFTNDISAADLVVTSTCGAVNKTEELSLIALQNIARKKSKSAKFIVTGCLPKIDPDKIREIRELGDFEFIPTRSLDKFDTVLNSKIRFEAIPDANVVTNEAGLLDYILAYRLFRHSFFLALYKRMSTNRYFLKSAIFLVENLNTIKSKIGLSARPKIVPYFNLRIAEGCAFACSYCSIKFATGRIKSKPIEKIVEEFKTGLEMGYQHFQLVCEDIGSYGLDLGTSLPALLKRLLEIEGDYSLILIDFGGYWLVKYYDELLPLFKENPDKIRELYVSLQSGSDKILKAMKRPEKIGDVRARLKELKKELPHLILRTTVIIGFPGETEEDFQKTIEAVRDIDFTAVELNMYEDRPGTVSSKREDKVPQEIIKKRYEEIKQYY
jgi:tRNA A37 methylthiotransferase MiaB